MVEATLLTANAQLLFGKLMQIPPNMQEICALLETGHFSSDDVSRAAVAFSNACVDESLDHVINREHVWEYQSRSAEVVKGEHSTFLFEIVKLLLEYGLDPNAVYEDENIMCDLRFIENEYVAADTMALLLEHGGDLDLEVDGDSVFSDIDFAVIFDAVEQSDRRRYDALVHVWFVCLGYGGRLKDGKAGLELYKDRNSGEIFELSKLKNHRNYSFGLTNVPCHGEQWSLHIFDKQTMWEVVRL